MRINISIPAHAQQLWTDIQAAATRDHATISGWLLEAAEQRLDASHHATVTGQPDADALASLIRRVVREELAARDAAVGMFGRLEIEARGAAVERLHATDGPESRAETIEPETTTTPQPKPAAQPCKHRHAVKGWCGECRTGGHL